MTTNDADTSSRGEQRQNDRDRRQKEQREAREQREREWDDAVSDLANKYVALVGYGGSVEALAQKTIFVAAANTASRTSIERAYAALLAGRVVGASLAERGM